MTILTNSVLLLSGKFFFSSAKRSRVSVKSCLILIHPVERAYKKLLSLIKNLPYAYMFVHFRQDGWEPPVKILKKAIFYK